MCMNKPKPYDGKGITVINEREYLQQNGYIGKEFKQDKYKTLSMKSFLQKDYGKDGDCTLTSILAVVNYYTNGQYDDNEIYNYIEKVAEKYFYNGYTLGTIPFFNKAIVSKTYKHFNINKTVTTKYIKDIGFKLKDITDLLDKNIPIIISIYKDGRKYYENHTVTIMGYIHYTDSENKEKTMLTVYDNWHAGFYFLDYNRLNPNCMICY